MKYRFSREAMNAISYRFSRETIRIETEQYQGLSIRYRKNGLTTLYPQQKDTV